MPDFTLLGRFAPVRDLLRRAKLLFVAVKCPSQFKAQFRRGASILQPGREDPSAGAPDFFNLSKIPSRASFF
jgi:hypothetical protein